MATAGPLTAPLRPRCIPPTPLSDAKYGTDPLVPYGTEPQVPITPGYVNRNHDEGVTSNGEVDLPF